MGKDQPRDAGPADAAAAIPGWRDLLRADLGRLQRGFSRPQARASRIFALLAKVLNEKRGHYEMRILYCPSPSLLWSALPGDGSTASFLHKFHSRAVWRERGMLARARLLAAFLIWPPLTAAMMVWFTFLNGRAIQRRTGKRIGRQMVEQLSLAAAHDVLPPWYYIYELFDDDKRRQAAGYLHRFETKGSIYRFLKRTPRDATRTPLGNKLHFWRWCRRHGIQTAPVLLAAEKGEFLSDGSPPDAAALPDGDLFVKPTSGRGGFGAERWLGDGAGHYRDGDGQRLTGRELLEHVRRRSAADGCIVQPRLVNHPDIAPLSNGALATVRLMTIESEDGGYEATHAVLRMAVGRNTTVDNFHAGGIAAPVDMRSGALGRATDVGLRPDVGWCEQHPDTRASIAGRVLPFWPETLALAARAHAAFPDRVVIGWDIAILADGPVIIEGNSGPDVDIVERVCGEPLGNSRFGALLAFHLRRALAIRYPTLPVDR
jgi:hypothetical protein